MNKYKTLFLIFIFTGLILYLPLHARAEEENEVLEAKKAYGRGFSHFTAKEYDKALEEFLKALELDPDFNYECYYRTAETYYKLENDKKAVEYYEKFLTYDYYIGDYTPLMYLHMGYCYEGLKNYEKAIESYEAGVDNARPNNGVYVYNDLCYMIYKRLGEVYKASEEYEIALEYYETCLDMADNPKDKSYFKKTIKEINELLEKGPIATVPPQIEKSLEDNAESHIELGKEYYEEKLYKEALYEFYRAIELEEENFLAHYYSGKTFTEEKEYNRAAFHFQTVLELNPDYSEALYELAIVYSKQGRSNEAIEYYEKYLEKNPESTHKEEIENTIAVLKDINESLPPPSNNKPKTKEPVIYLVEPVVLLYGKNLHVLEAKNNINLTGLVSSDEEITEVTVNGQAVELREPGMKNLELVIDAPFKYQFNAEIALFEGENEIIVNALTISNVSGEKNLTIDYNSDVIENPPFQKGEKWAVIIGVGNYESPHINDLNYSVSDAQAMYDFITAEGGYSPENVKLLLDEEATTKNIKSALGTFLCRKALSNDTVLIYFSGHGAPEPDPASTDGDGLSKYIVTYDSDPEDLYATAYPMKDIIEIFQRIEARKIVFFIDSCYSGATGGRTFARPGMKAGNISDGFLEELSRGEGRLIITASGPNEVSLELPEFGHGIFTYYLLKGLEGEGELNEDGFITIDELYCYLYDNVVKTSKEFGGNQHPVKKGESSGKIIIID